MTQTAGSYCFRSFAITDSIGDPLSCDTKFHRTLEPTTMGFVDDEFALYPETGTFASTTASIVEECNTGLGGNIANLLLPGGVVAVVFFFISCFCLWIMDKYTKERVKEHKGGG